PGAQPVLGGKERRRAQARERGAADEPLAGMAEVPRRVPEDQRRPPAMPVVPPGECHPPPPPPHHPAPPPAARSHPPAAGERAGPPPEQPAISGVVPAFGGR